MLNPEQHRGKAAACLLFAVALATMQDAVVKSVSDTVPAYEALLFRTLAALPILLGWLVYNGTVNHMFRAHVGALSARSFLLCSAYLCFVLATAALPLTTVVSIYFTMPFFVAGLSGYSLGEKVPTYRWLAIVSGFIGVLISIRPGAEPLQLGVFLALYSAFGYAVAQIWGRRLSHRVDPAVIVNWQNFSYMLTGAALAVIVWFAGSSGSTNKSIAFLTNPWVWPDTKEFWLLVFMGVLAAIAAVFFLLAYRYAEASFVAPLEYSAIIWATLYGIMFFGDVPDSWSILGTAIVIAAGLWMAWMDRRSIPTQHSH